MSSNVALMKTAVRSDLSNALPNAIRMTCTAHAPSLILEERPRQVDSSHSIAASIKRLCCQSTLNFLCQDLMNSGMFKILEWATSSDRSHTIGANPLCVPLRANNGNLLQDRLWNLWTGSFNSIKPRVKQNNSLVCLCAPVEKMFWCFSMTLGCVCAWCDLSLIYYSNGM